MGRTRLQYDKAQLPSLTRTTVDLQGHVRDFFVDAQERLVEGGLLRLVCHDTRRAGELTPANAPDVQIANARLTVRLEHFADFFDHVRVHFPIQQHAARIAQESPRPDAYHDCPTMPIAESSQFQCRNFPPTSAPIASMDVAASAITCTYAARKLRST